MTEIQVPVPEKELSQKDFVAFYADVFERMGYVGTILTQSAHLRTLLLHLMQQEDEHRTTLAELLDLAEAQGILNEKQMTQCRTLDDLHQFYSAKCLLNLTLETSKGVYYHGKVTDLLFELSQLLH